MKKIKAIVTGLVILASGLVAISPALAAGESIAITTTAYSPGNAANVGISLSGFDQNQSYQATVKFVNTSTNADVTNGTLTATQNGTSLISGYTSYAAAKLGFRGTYAQISAALSSITWNASTASGDISIRIGIASAPGTNEYYDANSERYYRFVSSGASWTNARTASENTTLFGLRGYLAEINSEAENTFIGTETAATNVWIGATDQTTEGAWIWDGATSTPKPVGSGTNAGRSATFHSWADGEPNDHGGGEDCAVTNWSGARGKWNDLPCGSSYSYLMEFGGRPGETSTATTVTLTQTVQAVNPTVISVAPIGGVTVPATGGTPVSTVTAANGYTGTVTWSPSGSPFAALTAYTATITLTAASSFTLTGVSANFFTVAGATSVTHNANSGVITAVFPATAIAPPAFTISSSSETATAGSAISGYSITSTGGAIASYAISPAISNTPGLSFDTATGLISGTPSTTATSTTYTITATNATSTATRTFSILVNPSAPAFTLSSSIETPTAGAVLNGYTISSTGGAIASYSISPAISNTPGLSFDTATGLISGTPTTPGASRTYTITATNVSGTATRTFVVTVNLAAPSFSLSTNSVSVMRGTLITGYSITSTGGAIESFSISPAISNSPGLTFSSVSGLISGTPTSLSGLQTYTITASNSAGSASRTIEINVTSPPPPSTLKTITSPRIQQDSSHYICLAGSFLFVRNGYTEEASKITSQRYFLVQDGKIVSTLDSMLSRATFEKKSSYLNTTLTCSVEVFQEGVQTTVSSLNSKLIEAALDAKREELAQVDVKYYADRTAAYEKKDKEFARIEEIRRHEIASAKTASAILLASAKYQKAFSAASELWKSELRTATNDRAAGRIKAESNHVDQLEKSGALLQPKEVKTVVAPTPTPTPTVTPKPTPTPSPSVTNPQPTRQMEKVGTVYMASGSYFLNDATKIALRAIALKINASGAESILVYGHTDNRGGVNNTVLSQNRARAVAKFLRPLVNTKKISVGWFASKKPVSGGTSAAALALNRRVEVYTK